MTATEVKIGRCYSHRLYGNCIVVAKNRLGYKIEVWGGPNEDKKYIFSGIKPEDLQERGRK